MKRSALGVSALLGVTLLTGCYPDIPDQIEEYDLVYTNFSPSFDFKAHATYSLPDSVVKLTGNLEQGEAPEMLNPLYGDQIIGRIRSNMNAYGWTEVAEGADPDVLILPSVSSSTTISVWYPSYYWGWYYPYYGYGYGWYYPGYYPPSVSSYTSGSLILQMTDPGDPSATDDTPVVWIGLFNGLMEGSTSGLAARVTKSIDQAFKQSEYLKQ